MTYNRTRLGATLVSLCVAAAAHSMPLHATFGASADDAGGASFDADIQFAPSERFSFNLGAGHSSGSDDSGNISGTLLDAGASLHGERGGFALSLNSFEDSSNYSSRTLGARAWFTAGDFEFALLARQRDNDVTLTLDLPLRTIEREVGFAGVGGGLQVGFTRGDFSAYVMALRYDYDADLDEFIELANSPLLSRRPRIEALMGSFMTQAQGAIDRQAAAGIERAFGRHALALDIASVHDAILDAGSVSVALTYRRTQSARVDWSVSGGMVDSEAYGSAAFAGVMLGLSN